MGPRPVGNRSLRKSKVISKKSNRSEIKYSRNYENSDKNILIGYFRHLYGQNNATCISLINELKLIRSNSSILEFYPTNTQVLKQIKSDESLPIPDSDSIKDDVDAKDYQLLKLLEKEERIQQRLSELQKEDVLLQETLDEAQILPKPKFQWDYMLTEMVWLAEDFNREKTWKRICAKKLANAAVKVLKERNNKISKEAKQETFKIRKHCAVIAKMIKDWWKQMEKIVLAKQQFRLNAKRQEAVTTHLGKVIETTEKYTEWLTEDLKSGENVENSESITSDPEYLVRPEDLESDGEDTDDEETIDIAEEQLTDRDIIDEMEILQKESKLNLDDIIEMLPAEYCQRLLTGEESITEFGEQEIKIEDFNPDQTESKCAEKDDERDSVTISDSASVSIEDEESSDDEETLLEQEKHECTETIESTDEVNQLANEADLPLEELMKQYHQFTDGEYDGNNNNNMDELLSCDSQSNTKSVMSGGNIGDSDTLTDENSDNLDDAEDADQHSMSSVELKNIFPNYVKKEEPEKKPFSFEGQFEALTEAALSTQPKGNTIESAGGVKVKIPNMLRHELREYQYVGLDWLAAIYEKRFNGILADEMGLGKTIQTIALLAYLACEKSIWGPHLIVVPTSVILNWEIEFKKWCPGFKILTYYGSSKERREKRRGWTKTNAFHVCITSYKLAIQDSLAFKRKKWKYFILDEAQNIKNFKSQRWQTLLTFNSQRRLLLTGTPLQNNLMELWSLMHFLMPNIFQSHKEFQEWFGSPLTGMIEGNSEYNEQLVKRLHKVLRPFILRRLKKDVEKQMPKKYEHIIMCRLSKRQRFLYDDFMSLTATQETLAGGQFLSVINILMQLRKVCNHPNLFETRPIISPLLFMNELNFVAPKSVYLIDFFSPNHKINFKTNYKPSLLPYGVPSLADMANNLPRFVNERIFGLQSRPNLIEEVDNIDVTDWVSTYRKNMNITTVKISRPIFTRSMFLTNLDEPTPSVISNSDEFISDSLSYNMYQREKTGLDVVKTFSNQSTNTNNTSNPSNLLPQNIVNNRQNCRKMQLKELAFKNRIRCSVSNPFGPDLVDLVRINLPNVDEPSFTNLARGRSLQQMFTDHMNLIKLFKFYVLPVLSNGIKDNSPPIINRHSNEFNQILLPQIKSRLPDEYFQARTQHMVQFPETRLIQYDCGKLQTLELLLKRLYKETHRCLIFTQMTRMLDILEHFLSYLGYRYLRLDGTTKVEQRQLLMETFNQDPRIFVFILSTRSGGLGVNLTGADTVIFYDSDWNPTMDAQAQDRCHRIGQTRDVHIYRLISQMTVEENILKKANQKRTLNDMAIEGGQFNTSFFKTSTLKDLFKAPSGLEEFVEEKTCEENQVTVDDNSNTGQDVMLVKTRSGRHVNWRGPKLSTKPIRDIVPIDQEEPTTEVNTELEAVLSQLEEENDRDAAQRAKAEVDAELEEFNEDIPWDEMGESNAAGVGNGGCEGEEDDNTIRLETERQIREFEGQLNPIQRFGVQMIESVIEDSLLDQLEMAQQNLECSKKTWHLEQLKALHEADEIKAEMDEDDMLYCYGHYDTTAQKKQLERLKREEAEFLEAAAQREKDEMEEEQEANNIICCGDLLDTCYNNNNSKGCRTNLMGQSNKVGGRTAHCSATGLVGKSGRNNKAADIRAWARRQHLLAMRQRKNEEIAAAEAAAAASESRIPSSTSFRVGMRNSGHSMGARAAKPIRNNNKSRSSHITASSNLLNLPNNNSSNNNNNSITIPKYKHYNYTNNNVNSNNNSNNSNTAYSSNLIGPPSSVYKIPNNNNSSQNNYICYPTSVAANSSSLPSSITAPTNQFCPVSLSGNKYLLPPRTFYNINQIRPNNTNTSNNNNNSYVTTCNNINTIPISHQNNNNTIIDNDGRRYLNQYIPVGSNNNGTITTASINQNPMHIGGAPAPHQIQNQNRIIVNKSGKPSILCNPQTINQPLLTNVLPPNQHHQPSQNVRIVPIQHQNQPTTQSQQSSSTTPTIRSQNIINGLQKFGSASMSATQTNTINSLPIQIPVQLRHQIQPQQHHLQHQQQQIQPQHLIINSQPLFVINRSLPSQNSTFLPRMTAINSNNNTINNHNNYQQTSFIQLTRTTPVITTNNNNNININNNNNFIHQLTNSSGQPSLLRMINTSPSSTSAISQTALTTNQQQQQHPFIIINNDNINNNNKTSINNNFRPLTIVNPSFAYINNNNPSNTNSIISSTSSATTTTPNIINIIKKP